MLEEDVSLPIQGLLLTIYVSLCRDVSDPACFQQTSQHRYQMGLLSSLIVHTITSVLSYLDETRYM